jgi:hypothetical protein
MLTHPTTDPYLAAFLLCEGGKLCTLRRVTAKKVEFRFATNRQLHVLLRTYWSERRIPVIPARLFDAYRTLKSRSPLDL